MAMTRKECIALASRIDVAECKCPLSRTCLAGCGLEGFPALKQDDPPHPGEKLTGQEKVTRCKGPKKCGICPLKAPVCEHVLAADDALCNLVGDDFDDGLRALGLIVRLAGDPGEWAERPLPAEPVTAISREDRCNLYFLRESNGEQLFHEKDIVSLDQVCVDADRGAGLLTKQSSDGIRRDLHSPAEEPCLTEFDRLACQARKANTESARGKHVATSHNRSESTRSD